MKKIWCNVLENSKIRNLFYLGLMFWYIVGCWNKAFDFQNANFTIYPTHTWPRCLCVIMVYIPCLICKASIGIEIFCCNRVKMSCPSTTIWTVRFCCSSTLTIVTSTIWLHCKICCNIGNASSSHFLGAWFAPLETRITHSYIRITQLVSIL